VCGDNGTWGIFSGFADYITVEDNECYGSKKEHGIYLSNSADYATVKRNHCHHNKVCGIQFNGDPNIPGGDGIMSYNLVEGNILHHNGNSLNLTCVSDSVVRSNLFYGQNTKAIALWDTMAGYQYSSKRNILINNTVIMDLCTRECIQMRNGATHNVVRNNILVAPFQAIVADPSSVEGTVIDHNLYFGSREPERFLWAGEYRTVKDMQAKGFCQGDASGDPKFVNQAEADFRPAADSPAIGAGVMDDKAGDVDLAGKPRSADGKIDIGAYQHQGK
jgi:parallel beta-helix repeat protein